MFFFALFRQQLLREGLLLVRQRRLIVNACLFFLMVVVFFPLTMAPEVSLLRKVAPGVIWIAILLAFFLSSERLFQQDHDDGVIEQWLVSGDPVAVMVSAKVVVHWMLTVLPMLMLLPLLAALFSLTLHETLILMLSLVCGTPTLFYLCALAAAFSTDLKQKGLLMALILLPLTMPVMILGSGTVVAVMHGVSVQAYLALLLAMSVFSAGYLPFAIAAVIRIGLVG
jgi:heme exporter protein B